MWSDLYRLNIQESSSSEWVRVIIQSYIVFFWFSTTAGKARNTRGTGCRLLTRSEFLVCLPLYLGNRLSLKKIGTCPPPLSCACGLNILLLSHPPFLFSFSLSPFVFRLCIYLCHPSSVCVKGRTAAGVYMREGLAKIWGRMSVLQPRKGHLLNSNLQIFSLDLYFNPWWQIYIRHFMLYKYSLPFPPVSAERSLRLTSSFRRRLRGKPTPRCACSSSSRSSWTELTAQRNSYKSSAAAAPHRTAAWGAVASRPQRATDARWESLELTWSDLEFYW